METIKTAYLITKTEVFPTRPPHDCSISTFLKKFFDS